MISPTSDGETPASATALSTPARTPSSGACGVVSTLAVIRRAPISRATSVKVPPTLTARRGAELEKVIGEPLLRCERTMPRVLARCRTVNGHAMGAAGALAGDRKSDV